MKVKFVDLSAQHKTLENEIKEVFNRVLANCSFVLGPEVEKFEKAFATYCEVSHCVAVTNGTAAKASFTSISCISANVQSARSSTFSAAAAGIEAIL